MPTSGASQDLDRFAGHLSGFAEQQLRPYLDRIQERLRDRPTEVNDPVWGTIVLEPSEVVILDSPLIQRLRRIRQLGVVHFVFPGATHTRFDHSIGIVNRVTALIDAANNSARRQTKTEVIDSTKRQLLRIAALCHDIGHGFMSHVSEKAIDSQPKINSLQRAFTSKYRVEDPHLSEMIAFFMIRAPAATELLECAWKLSTLPPPDMPVSEFVADVIVGRTVSDDIPLLHEFVSGPYDADKLDYLTRDAVCCGVPKVVDIPRLIQKIRIVRQGTAQLPREIADCVQGGEGRLYSVTAVASSGASTLDELALARALLHDKVYRHQKVRAAEAMVASATLSMARLMERPELVTLEYHDEGFLDIDMPRLEKTVGADEESRDRRNTAIDLIARLRSRDLFVRAFTWSQTPLTIGQDSEEEQTERLHELLLSIRRSRQRGHLAKRIASKAAEILDLTGHSAVLDAFRDRRLPSYVWIDPPAVPKGRALLARAYLVNNEGLLQRFSEAYPDTEGWSNQYLVNREIGYVFSTRSLAPAVYLAAEEIFRIEFGVRVRRDQSQVGVGIENEIRSMRTHLSANGYYDKKPSDLLPRSSVLSLAGTEQKLDDLVRRASGYAAPLLAMPTSPLTPGLSRSAAIDFLQQFRRDDWIEEGLKLLTRLRVLTRSDVFAGVSTFLQNNPDYRGGYLCSLGGPKDSSAIHTYVATDVAEAYEMKVCAVSELPPTASRVLFVDDFIGSGRQAIDIVEAWIGVERSADLGEERKPLAEQEAAVLRSATSGFVFTAGFDAGAARLRARLTELEIANTVFVSVPEDQLPVAFGAGLFADASPAFEAECRRIGASLLESTGAEPEIAASRALGYGNRGLLLVFPANTPAQSLTLLWSTGEVDGVPWKPLFPRRRKF